MNAPCHIWMHHVTYKCTMSHMNAPCHMDLSLSLSYHIWMHYVTHVHSCHILRHTLRHTLHGAFTSHMISCHIWMHHVTWLSPSLSVTCHIICDSLSLSIMSPHTWMHHVTWCRCIKMCRFAYEPVMSHLMCLVAKECAMSRMRIRQVTLMSALHHTYKSVPWQMCRSHATHIHRSRHAVHCSALQCVFDAW